MPDLLDASEVPLTESRDRRSEIDAHFQVATVSVVSALCGAGFTCAAVAWAGALDPATAWSWLLAMMAMGAVHLGLAAAYKRASAWRARWRIWAWLTSAISLGEGLGWGLAPFAIPRGDSHEALLLVTVVTLCVSAGSIIGYGRYPPTRVIAFVTPTIPYMAYSLVSDDPIIRGSFPLMVLFLVALGNLGITADKGFRREISMRKRNAVLAADLQRQKEIADRANVAKSAFLAAASHDLRQPIHALGLYLGLLRGAKSPTETQALADKMEASISAMDRLFAAILDISRLDAGVVEVRPETFAASAALESVCADFREMARLKGLAIVVDRADDFIRTDRVLFERILRNLVSNAVRYTDAGGVRLRCRRRGRSVVVQVWDSGRGVERRHYQAIFEEYFQAGNPERDRDKGLGLGLAIVRRVATLLGASISVMSRVGRGTMFAVRVPAGRARDAAKASEPSSQPWSRPEGLVVVIDDDKAILEAMRSILEHWGFEVVAAPSGDVALATLQAERRAPAILICDYRLRGEENGVAVIRQFRSRYGLQLPTILVTGDTAPERIAEAEESGALLMHKPVSHGKLRAAIGNLAPAAREAAGAHIKPVTAP